MKERTNMETKRTFKEIEKQIIIDRLVTENGNMTKTAQSLDLGLRTVQRKLRSYGYSPGLGGSKNGKKAVDFATKSKEI
jgi:DNA-binding NtrC family response regulator